MDKPRLPNFIFDNGNPLRPHRLIARFNKGKLVTLRNIIPSWANGVFAEEFSQFRASHLNSM